MRVSCGAPAAVVALLAGSVLPFAALGEGDKAAQLFSLLNPINHARTRAEVHRYKVEPYVVAADVYAAPCRARRVDVVHGVCGLDASGRHREHPRVRLRGEFLRLDPCIPKDWPSFEMTGSIRRGAIRDPGGES